MQGSSQSSVAHDADQVIRLIRMGDYYEAFGENAKLVARICGLCLTNRMGKLLAGFPVHHADEYIAKIRSAGLTVDVGTAKGGAK